MFSIIIWSIWKERNARIFQNVISSPQEVQDLILTRVCWWIKGWGDPFPFSTAEVIRNPICLAWAGNCIIGAGLPKLKPALEWNPPNQLSLKWNVDASVNISKSLSAIGGVLRDCRGVFKCVFSTPIPHIEINSAEILAIYRAVQISMSFDS